LSEDEIERMVHEAEFFSEQDKAEKEKIEARNGLEAYLYNLKNSLADGTGDKMSETDKETFSSIVEGALEWLEDNPNAEKEECDEKQKEVESIANPILKKAYTTSNNGHGQAGASDDFMREDVNGGGDDTPSVEEVD